MRVKDLETPVLIFDRDKLDANAKAANDMLRGTNARLRPHYKSHKCAALAHEQLRAGAVGMTCAKLSEAEDLIYSGVEDILIANQVVEPSKVARIASLAGKCRLTVCVDCAENAQALSRAAVNSGSTVYCLVEYELGMRRCGVTTKEEYLALARLIMSLPGLEYAGIQAYAGYAAHLTDASERVRVTNANLDRVRELIRYLGDNGVTVTAVSGASTGTSAIVAPSGVYTELQAGSYLFMDATYNRLGLPFVNSLYVLSTVISTRPGITVLDVGAKGLAADQNPPELLTLDGVRVTGEMSMNEEHLKLYNASLSLAVGDKVLIVPGHCCTTVNLYDQLYVMKDGRVIDRLPITARGCSR